MATSKDEYDITRTVWRSGRVNNFGDELVVAEGLVNSNPSFIMAWEVTKNRPECVSWDGKIAYFPRMFWEDIVPKNYIKVYNHAEEKYYLIKEDKHYQVIDGDVYIKYKEEEKTKIYQPLFINVLNVPSALTKAIAYVQWFNENQRQLDTHDRLLSLSKQARKRRRKRAEYKINTRV